VLHLDHNADRGTPWIMVDLGKNDVVAWVNLDQMGLVMSELIESMISDKVIPLPFYLPVSRPLVACLDLFHLPYQSLKVPRRVFQLYFCDVLLLSIRLHRQVQASLTTRP
jgi:hypothetical protein